jgi:hypothetical protein
MRHVGILIIGFTLLTGCAMINHDRSDAPGMDALMGKSFVIEKDSFLIENYCADLYATKDCVFMQVTGGFIERKTSKLTAVLEKGQLPGSFEEFARDPKAINDDLAERGLLDHTRHDIVGVVTKGTVIIITRVMEAAHGEDGSGWLVYGTLQSQPGISIQIGPGQLSFSGSPSWLKRVYPFSGIPQPSPDYLQPATP